MKNIIFSYIFRSLFVAFFVVFPVVVMMVWITMSLRYISLIVSNDISLLSFLKLILCALPDISGLTIPICTLIASISVFYKMQQEKETLVLMASGKTKFSLTSPLFLFSAIVSVVVLFFQTVVTPYSYKNLTNIQDRIKSQISTSIIKPGVFNAVGNTIIYVQQKDEASIKDVFISYITKNKQTNIITAKEGRYYTKDNNLIVNLSSGYRQELDQNNKVVSILKFDNFSYDVSDFIKTFSQKVQKVHEKTQSELKKAFNTSQDISIKKKSIAEYHKRLIFPFILIINGIITSIFMLEPNPRTKNSINALKTFFCGVLCQICIMTLTNISSKYTFIINLNYAVLLIAICILLWISFRKKNCAL